MYQKSPTRDAFFLFQSQASIFHDEKTSSASFPDAKKARMVLQLSPKSTTLQKKKDDRQTNKKPNSLVSKISKFKKFKNSILTHTYLN